ncbi:hypothetical protein EH196_00470 [Bacillus sp. C1-1]|nr:hypothetical protein EH196_00470 [Bacillus sp. C1-1]
MLVPNKIIRYNDSVIGKMTVILNHLHSKDMHIRELYFITQKNFKEIDEFIYSIDVLYLLDAIDIDFTEGIISYVKENKK